MRTGILILVVFGLASSLSMAETVEEATQRYVEVMRSGDMVAAAELFDAAELERFRNSMIFLTQMPDSVEAGLFDMFFGEGSTVESISGLSNQEFFAAFLRFTLSQDAMGEAMQSAELTYLGHVMEGDDVAHAVTRISLTIEELSVEAMEVASFVRRGDQWKMKMSGEFKGLADALRNSLAN